MRLLDRYLVREILLPLFLVLAVFTFILLMPPILQQGERLIAHGVGWTTVVHVLWTLVPQAISITIPMALLGGILIGLGRLSADREFVALQACGVSIFRILRPIFALAIVGWAVNSYVMIALLPDANQTFREITFNIVASQSESDIRPRVFFQEFPNRVIYVRDVPPGGGWRDVFLADETQPDQSTVYFARTGRLLVDRRARTVQLLLEDGTWHRTFTNKPAEYEGSSFDRIVLSMDPESVFPRTTVMKGDPERTIAELRAVAAENARHGLPYASQLFTIQQKFAIPAACLVLSLIGVALGVTNRKDGKLASFAIGFGVIFVYYVLLYMSRAGALGGRLSPTLAPWIANIVLGAAGVALVLWRAGSADQSIRIPIPAFWRRSDGAEAAGGGAPTGARRRRVVLVVRVPHVDWPRPRLLDVYVSRRYLAVFGLAFVSLVGIFYISTFIDLADKLFRGTATTGMLLRYFYFATPQYVYYIIPISALVATLVTIGLLTKNSELIVMRACGISLYRSAVPVLLFAIAFSGVLFELQEHVLAETNREAQRLNAIIRGYPVQTFGVLNRRWVVGRTGDLYHYDFFEPRVNEFSRLTIFHLDQAAWKLNALTYANDVVLARRTGADGRPALQWVARHGWMRAFTTAMRDGETRTAVAYAPFEERGVSLGPPGDFKTEEPDAERMTYGELKQYITQLRASGYYVVPYMVQLQRKVAFPFVTLIMTLLAVPFAVTTGRRGAMYGIGVGIVLSIVYWTALSVFGALGSGGWMAPALAAWAPNIIFGSAAVSLLLTVRT